MIITNAEAVAYLRDPDASEQDVSLYVSLTNTLIESVASVAVNLASVEVKLIALGVVARAWRNPRGAESETERIDDYSRTWRISEAGRVGVYLTAAERATLTGVDPSAGNDGWAGSIGYQQ